MKYILLLCVFIFSFGACSMHKKDEKVVYSLNESEFGYTYIPEKNREKYTQFIATTVGSLINQNGVSVQVSEGVISEAKEIADKLYSVPRMDLCIMNRIGGCERVNIMNMQQMIIQDSLIKIYEERLGR